MTFEYKIYVVKDWFGTVDATVANDSSETIQISRMRSKDGEYVYFESDAYHLQSWCDEIGAELIVLNKAEEINP